MRSSRIGTLGLILTAAVAAVATANTSIPPEAGATDHIKRFLDRLGRVGFSGAVLVAKGDDILVQRGVGLADREHERPWTCDTVSSVGSITKQFTAAAILKLEEAGRLSVSDPISKHLQGAPDDKANITVHQLLTHTAGFPGALGDDIDPIGRDEFVALAFETPLQLEPGAGYEYSNVGYSLLGAIVENASGKPYETYLRSALLEPAGCGDTGYMAPNWPDERLAIGYRGGERWGTVLEKNWRTDGPGWHLRCNGGVHSTVNDMLRWVNALRSGDVLSRASLEKMWTPFADEGGGESYYGYGWALPVTPFGALVTHNGGNGIVFADLAFQPEDDGWVICIMTTVASEFPGAEGLLGLIGRRLLAGAPLPDVPDAQPLSSDAARTAAGVYALEGDGGAVSIVPGPAGSLVATVEGRRAYALMNNAGPDDADAIAEFNSKTERFMRAMLDGDFGPLVDAYQGRHSLEVLRNAYTARLNQQEEMFGAVTGLEIVGSSPLHGGIATLVRLDRERGSTWHRYQWDNGVLDGQFPMMRAPRLSLHHIGDGEFVAWSLDEGEGARVHIDTSTGKVLIGLGSGDEAPAQRR